MSESDSLVSTDLTMPPLPPSNKLDLLILFSDTLNLKEKADELINLNINKEGLNIIQTILEYSPDTFSSISEKINEILKDGVLNSDDVPILINLIKDVINLDVKKIKKDVLTIENVLIFVKTILEILIVKELIKVNNKDKVFQLIDVSFTLLTTTIDVNQSLFACLKKCFKC